MDNRIIKFRAWDEYKKEMYYDVTYDRDSEGGVRPFIFTQFTGLRDKNRKEIYEGDVIVLDSAPYKYKILWDKWRLTIVGLNNAIATQSMTSAIYNRAIIIGNIFENPELLN